jgi:pyruvate/2-oxoglutarate dehydrogenase complex dihydrolipoamide acyltransferase (E2) component
MVLLGDPDEALNFLIGLLKEFEDRGQDMRRSRAAAFFDSDLDCVYLEKDEEADEAAEQAAATADRKSEPRSRSSSDVSCETFDGEEAEPSKTSGRAFQRAAPQGRRWATAQATSAAAAPKSRERSPHGRKVRRGSLLPKVTAQSEPEHKQQAEHHQRHHLLLLLVAGSKLLETKSKRKVTKYSKKRLSLRLWTRGFRSASKMSKQP